MNDFLTFREKAVKEYDKLQHPTKPVIYIGMGSCGLASGDGEVWQRTHEILDREKIKAKVLKVGCIGPCYLEPFLDIQIPGSPRMSFNNVSVEKLEKLLPSYLLNGKSKIKIVDCITYYSFTGRISDTNKPLRKQALFFQILMKQAWDL